MTLGGARLPAPCFFWAVGALLAGLPALASDPHSDFDRLLREGRFAAAEARLEEVGRRAAGTGDREARSLLVELQARYALDRRRWSEAEALPVEGLTVEAQRVAWFARGLGAARAAWPGGTGPRASRAREAARTLLALAKRQGQDPDVELDHLLVRAALAAAQEERQEMALLLTQALSLDDRDPPIGARPRIIPVRELAGDLWLQVARYADAAREYRVSTEQDAGRPRSWLGLARASARAGDVGTARQAYARFLELWSHADPGAPELSEARAY